MEDKHWYKNAVFYEVNVRAFSDSNGDGKGDLAGLTSKLDYLKGLGVDCLWLLPVYPSPLQDDGYDIADFYGIHPDYGSLEGFRVLLKTAHEKGLRIITDLVLNHTSDQHPWFKEARAEKDSPYHDYYVWSDNNLKYSKARIIFLDTEESNWSWDDLSQEYYWHRFYSSQPDLNYDNPAVRAEILKIMKYWLDLGVDGFRADAVPYLFEREGTNCENLPETHAFLKELRKFVDENYPGRILLCEANQWPNEVRVYFGDSDPETGIEQPEFQMGFHFPLMPRIFMALRQEDFAPIQWALDQTPAIPDDCQWCTFLRNHDELTLEMVTQEEREWMWKEYAPEPRMRLNLGIRRRLAPLLDNDIRKLKLAFAIIFSLPGTPIIYYGDEIGMGDNIDLTDRNGVRTPMQWDSSPTAGFSTSESLYSPLIAKRPYRPTDVNVEAQKADPDSLWNTIQKMIAVRKRYPAFGAGSYEQIDCGSKSAFGYLRRNREESILVINNLGSGPMQLNLSIDGPVRNLDNLLNGDIIKMEAGQVSLTLEPYGFLWLDNC